MLKKTAQRFWCGNAPETCQICARPITACFVDGKTQWGPWGFMCPDCHETHGEGLGIGLGQMYGRQADGRWLKLEEPKMTTHPFDRQREADQLVERLLDQIANDDFIEFADQLREGPKVVEIWDYPVTHDGDLDNPVQ